MVNMFEVVDYLCKKHHVSVAVMCRAIGMQPSVITDLKHGRTKNLSHANMVKIANYFQISTDVFSEGVLEETFPSCEDMESIAGYHYLGKEKKPAPENGDGLNPIDKKFMDILPQLTQEHKEMLLAQIEVLLKGQQQ